MDSIVIYFLQSGISLVVFYLVFWFWLRKETFFQVNRYYLLVAIVVSMVLPLFTMDYTIHQKLTQVEYEPAETVELPLIRVQTKEPIIKKVKVQHRNTIASLPTVRIFAPNENPLPQQEVLEEESLLLDTLTPFVNLGGFQNLRGLNRVKPKKIKESEIKVTTTPTTIVKMHEPFTVVRTAPRIPLTIAKVLVIIYLIGASLFFLRLVYQIIVFILTLRKSKSFYYRGTKVIVCESQFVPYSFFNVICLNPETYQNQSLEKIMTHEQIHIHQRHYLDLLLTELVAVIQWFNPVVWNYEKSLKETHEYLADHGVLARGFDKAGYQSLLLNQVVGVQMFGLANNFNHSLTKKRIIMMTKMQSPQWAKLKVLLVLPALCCIMFAFAKPVYTIDKQLISKKIVNTVKKVETPIEKAVSNVETVSINEDDILLEESLSNNEDDMLLVDSFSKDDTIYTNVDKIPEFEGGELGLMNFIFKKTKYPKEAIGKDIQGKVLVRFVVTSDASIKDASVLISADSLLDKEALRVINLLKFKTPAMKNGKAVNMWYVVPICFELDGDVDFPTIQLNKLYTWRNYNKKGEQLCTGWYMFTAIENGTYIGFQRNETCKTNWNVTAQFSKDSFLIHTPEPWNENWKGTYCNGKLAKGNFTLKGVEYGFEFDVVANPKADSISKTKVNTKDSIKTLEKPNFGIQVALSKNSESFTVKLARKVEDNASMEILNSELKVLNKVAISQAATVFNIDTLKEGYYYLNVVNGQEAFRKSFNKPATQIVKDSPQTTKKSLTLDTKTIEKVEDASIKIYPNPNDGKFAVEISGTIEANAKIQIYDVKGELVKEVKVSQAKTDLNLDSAKGSYLVKVTNGTKIVSKNIVKQ